MHFLKQSTAVYVNMGPFLDSSDGITEETGLGDITVEVSKAGAAFAARNSGTANAHDTEGYYRVHLDTTDTGTVGPLRAKAHESGALPVWEEFFVLPAATYDALVTNGLNDLSAADVNAEVDTALSDYDPPTHTELTNALAGLNDLSAADVNAECDTAISDAFSFSGGDVIATLDGEEVTTDSASRTASKADVSALAIESNVEGHVATVINTYDPPTHAELTSGLAGLNDPTAAEIVNALVAKTGITVGGSATFGDILKALYASARGKITKSGDVYTFKDDDDSTTVFTLTITDSSRTVS